MASPLYLIAQIGFVLLSIGIFTLLILEIRKGVQLTDWDTRRRKGFIIWLLIWLLTWVMFVSAWSLSGKMADFSFFPFNILPVILIPVVVAVIFIPSQALGDVLKHIPPDRLIRLQTFRFFVEVLLWILFIAQLLPVQMTFEGRNLDILTGLTAPIIAVWASKNRNSDMIIILWNIICLVLLLNIVITALLSTPSPWRVFMNEPANDIVTYFPMAWLPGLLVPLAYYLHFMSLRQVLLKNKGINGIIKMG